MTPAQIKALSDQRLDCKIADLLELPITDIMVPDYSTDLSAAWPLQFDIDVCDSEEIEKALAYQDPRRCARLISEAFLWLKTKGE